MYFYNINNRCICRYSIARTLSKTEEALCAATTKTTQQIPRLWQRTSYHLKGSTTTLTAAKSIYSDVRSVIGKTMYSTLWLGYVHGVDIMQTKMKI